MPIQIPANTEQVGTIVQIGYFIFSMHFIEGHAILPRVLLRQQCISLATLAEAVVGHVLWDQVS
jgi:hypothetical protein